MMLVVVVLLSLLILMIYTCKKLQNNIANSTLISNVCNGN